MSSLGPGHQSVRLPIRDNFCLVITNIYLIRVDRLCRKNSFEGGLHNAYPESKPMNDCVSCNGGTVGRCVGRACNALYINTRINRQEI